MPQFYVYVYRDPSRKNEPIYVGKGQDDRAYVHLKRKDKHPFTHRLQLMNRNGIEPIINVVDMPSEALAFQCEVDTIARFGRKDLKLGPLLNQTDGGEGASGWVPSAESRKKNSDANKGKSRSLETRRKMSEAAQNMSTEHRQKLSNANKGENNGFYDKSHSATTKARISATLKGKSQPIVTCPHCGKEGGAPQMKQWHFDNCKYKK